MKGDAPCFCNEHFEKKAPTTIGDHRFRREHDTENGFWRWRCTCGKRGKWQAQSPSVSYHQWLDHVRRSDAPA